MTLITSALGLDSLEFVQASDAVLDEDNNVTTPRRVIATSTTKPNCCAACGSYLIYKHGTRENEYVDAPHYGQPCTLVVTVKRWRCQDCSHTFSDPLPEVDANRRCTKRMLEYVRGRVFKYTFAEVAREVGVDDKTIRHIFDDIVAELAQTYEFKTPTCLGIDEVKITGAYRCMLTNIEKSTIYELLPDRSMKTLRAYFATFKNPQDVKFFTADLWNNYDAIAREFFPNAVVIPDRFHVQRMASNAMEVVRKLVRKTLDRKDRLKQKDERFLLLKNARDLSESQRQKIDAWFKPYPLLHDAWTVKEGYVAFWQSTTRAEASKAAEAWLQSIPPSVAPYFKELVNVMNTRLEQILNYFDYPITNAYTESINRAAKSLNRNARGSSFEVLRAKMLYDTNAIKKGTLVKKVEVPQPPPEPDPLENAESYSFVTTSTEYRPRRPKPTLKVYQEVIEYYGADINTVCDQMDAGMFDQVQSDESTTPNQNTPAPTAL